MAPEDLSGASSEQSNDAQAHPFDNITPDFLLDAVESRGFCCDGRFLTLNSYENRVYQVGIDDATPIIAKFYRPERWTTEQIIEEHKFSQQLADAELPVIAPLILNGSSMFEYQGFRIALFERKGGHAPELDNLDNLFTLGRVMGRIHQVAKAQTFEHRPVISPHTFGYANVEAVTEHAIPAYLKESYRTLTHDLLAKIDSIWQKTNFTPIRVHGDCHSGNVLWRDEQPHFVDFDDSRMAPAIQDLWMFLSGSRDRQSRQLLELVEGYEEFCAFNPAELMLVESLRTLRMIRHSAWIAKRWHDPAFPIAFPDFAHPNYWEQHILDLREQLSVIDEPPLKLFP